MYFDGPNLYTTIGGEDHSENYDAFPYMQSNTGVLQGDGVIQG